MDIMEMWRLIYQEDLPPDIGPIRDLLEDYSGVKPNDVDAHLHRIRKQAWDATRYPCIGRWRFLYIDPTTDPRYRFVLSRLLSRRSPELLLDLGCCVGQALRQLSSDGVHPSRLVGLDINPALIDIGFDLFCDRGRTPASFIVGDVLDPRDKEVARLDGRVSVVHASNFWHLFPRSQQFAAAVRLVGLFREGDLSAMIYGRQVGVVNAAAQQQQHGRGSGAYLHDQRSFQRLWDEVGAATGTRWRVEMEFFGERLVKIPGFGADSMAARYGVYRLN